MTETVPPNSPPTALDDGCGLDTVSAELKESFPNLPVVAIDSSTGMIDVVNRKAEEHGWKKVDAKVLDGGDLTGTRSPYNSISTHTTSRVAVHFTRKSAHAHAHSTPLTLPLPKCPQMLTLTPTQRVSSSIITQAFGTFFIDLAHNVTACVQELHCIIAPRRRHKHHHLGRAHPPRHLDLVGKSLSKIPSGVQSALDLDPEVGVCGEDSAKPRGGGVEGCADEAGNDALEVGERG